MLNRRRLLQAMGMTAASAVCVAPATASDSQSYLLTTGTTGGTYYPVGVAIATLAKVKLQATKGISISAISSAGSAENVKLLYENQAQFGIIMGLYGEWAFKGTGPLASRGTDANLRSVSMLWQNVEHFLILTKYAKSGTIDDLSEMSGLRFSIGKRNSGAFGSTGLLLRNLGIDPEQHFDMAYLGYGPTADAMQNGTVAATNLPAGPPVGAVARAFATLKEDLTILSFTDEQIARANAGGSLWSAHDIPAGTYPGQNETVRSIAQPNFLATRSDVSVDAVYEITKALYENLGFLRGIHKATTAMSLEKAIAGLPVPLHAGAARYYREVGLDIPSTMLAD